MSAIFKTLNLFGHKLDLAIEPFPVAQSTPRDLEVYASRMAAFKLLDHPKKALFFKPGIGLSLLEETRLNHNFRFDFVERGSLSLSHTRGFGAALYSKENLAFGLDIEWSDRVVKPEVLRFFWNEKDHPSFREKPFQLWCLKEAAFKALSIDRKIQGHLKNPVLSQIVMMEDSFYLEIAPKLQGQWNFSSYEIKDCNRTLAVAIAVLN